MRVLDQILPFYLDWLECVVGVRRGGVLFSFFFRLMLVAIGTACQSIIKEQPEAPTVGALRNWLTPSGGGILNYSDSYVDTGSTVRKYERTMLTQHTSTQNANFYGLPFAFSFY